MLKEIFNISQMEMCPLDFRSAWGLSSSEAAAFLGITERTLYYYQAVNNRKNPSVPVKRLAALLTRDWLIAGKQPAQSARIPQHLFNQLN